MSGAEDLIAALRDPSSVTALNGQRWTALISVARTEVLLGTLAHRAAQQPLPERVAMLFDAHRLASVTQQRQALWEADRASLALKAVGVVPVLLKGTAYAAAGLTAAIGRQIGDLDILVPHDQLRATEAALLDAGWRWLKPDPYDDAYYRRWMHELPPMIHGERERMIDVHHTILPLTHRKCPDAAALYADSALGADGHRILSTEDRIVHCAAHLLADGDLEGGLRNLWDLHCLLSDGVDWSALEERSALHELASEVRLGARLAASLYGTIIPAEWSDPTKYVHWYRNRLLARDDWGRPSRAPLRRLFYMRSHLLRMPPLMLARHLWTKSLRR